MTGGGEHEAGRRGAPDTLASHAAPGSPPAGRAPLATALMILVAAAAALLLGSLLERLFTLGMSQSYDTMLYGRSLWGVAHDAPFNPVYGMHWAGIHANWVLYLLAPLTRVAPAWQVLVWAQAAAFGVTVALVLSAVDRSTRRCAAAVRALAWVWGAVAVAAAPLVLNPFLFDARPDLIAVPLVLAAMLRADERGGWDSGALVLLALASSVREEFAIVGAAALLTASFDPRRDERPRLGPAARFAAAAVLLLYFAAYWFWLRPSFGEGFAAARADQAANELFVGGPDAGRYRAAFALALLATGGGLALRGWRWWIPALPGIVFAASTTKLAPLALNFHYPMFAAPALATAAIAGLRATVAADARPGQRPAGGSKAAALLGLALLIGASASHAFGAHPAGGRFQGDYFGADPASAEWLRDCRTLLGAIPPDAGVAAPPMFGAELADREVIWSTETLTRALADTGAVPAGVDWIAIDNNRFGTLGRVLVNRHGFQLVGVAAGRLALFERPPSPDRAPPALAAVGVQARCDVVAVTWPEPGLRLCDLRRVDDRVVGRLVRLPHATPSPPVAILLEVDGNPTVLEAVWGLVDPSTLPAGAAVEVRSRDRFAAPRGRLHLQALDGRHFMGVGPDGQPAMGVEVSILGYASPDE